MHIVFLQVIIIVYLIIYANLANFFKKKFIGYGQERGGIKVNIFNKSTNMTVPIIYYDVIPWFLKLYLHTLKVQINGEEVRGIEN